MIFAGVDPGLSGAIAVIDGSTIVVQDTPTFVIHGKKNRREYDLPSMRKILNSTVGMASCFLCIELVHSMPDQGIVGAFTFGRGLGLWEGLIVGLNIPYERVAPQRWKKAMLKDMQKGKGASIAVAKQLYPSVDLHRVKDHNKADALLLAEYARRTYVPI